MPHIFDFDKCLGDILTVDINPEGWIGPITIEYGIAQNNVHDPMLSVVWRIKGTTHTFSIYETRLNNISHGNYKEHFKEALENFRKDYLSWFKEKGWEETSWVREYEQQYGNLILPEQSSDN